MKYLLKFSNYYLVYFKYFLSNTQGLNTNLCIFFSFVYQGLYCVFIFIFLLILKIKNKHFILCISSFPFDCEEIDLNTDFR